MEQLTDNALMLKVKDGDLEKLGLLFERYHRMLFGFFFKVHSDDSLAQDLVQSVFMRILKYRTGFKGEGEFKIWMMFIARNLSNDHFRKIKRHGFQSDVDDLENRLSDYEEMQVKEQQQDEERILWKALQSMDQEKRELIVLGKLEGMKYKDIAKLYDATESNIKIKIFRALKELKSLCKRMEAAEN